MGHPVEVVGRIRDSPDGKSTALSVQQGGQTIRVRTEQGYRDFVLDGVSLSGEESLTYFYTRYVQARVEDVRLGGRCTILMYGPTGAGKSHTMFGSAKEPGVAYLALRQMMNKSAGLVSANVLEIYNEDVYDLLAVSTTTPLSSPGPRSLKNSGRPKLEVRGRKVRNVTSISSLDPAKLIQEITKVEKRRVVKSTSCNERSSRSHCMVVLEILGVGGRLVLVDMAGSENSDQAGAEAKLQTGKINQGNGALKRVVESIANGCPYIPYRDSKLTMLLQDSFEDDGSKILMVLCASPDPRDVHKTISTLEYGAKAKSIVRLPNSPTKETSQQGSRLEAILEARLQQKDELIERLREEYEAKLKEQEEEIEKLRARAAKAEAELSKLTNNSRKSSEKLGGLFGLEKKKLNQLSVVESFKFWAQEPCTPPSRCRNEGEVSNASKKLDLDIEPENKVQESEQRSDIFASSLPNKKLEPAFKLVSEEKNRCFSPLPSTKEEPELKDESNGSCFLLSSKTVYGSYSPLPSRNEVPELKHESDEKNSQTVSPGVLQEIKQENRSFSRSRDEAATFIPVSPSRKLEPELKQESDQKTGSCLPLVAPEHRRCTTLASRNRDEAAIYIPVSPRAPKVPLSPDAAAARKARIENIFLLCGDGRERSRSAMHSPRGGVPLRPVENLPFCTTPPSSGKSKDSLVQRDENLAPATTFV